jgi:hypothetical protein
VDEVSVATSHDGNDCGRGPFQRQNAGDPGFRRDKKRRAGFDSVVAVAYTTVAFVCDRTIFRRPGALTLSIRNTVFERRHQEKGEAEYAY